MANGNTLKIEPLGEGADEILASLGFGPACIHQAIIPPVQQLSATDTFVSGPDERCWILFSHLGILLRETGMAQNRTQHAVMQMYSTNSETKPSEA